MRKRIILIGLIIINGFTLLGCGQTKEELKKEIKTELKQETAKEQETKISGITEESLKEFKTSYYQYTNNMMQGEQFMLPDGNDSKKTLEESKEFRNKAKSMEEDMLSECPKYIKDDLSKYINIYNELLDKFEEYMENNDETLKIGLEKGKLQVIIQDKISELESELAINN